MRDNGSDVVSGVNHPDVVRSLNLFKDFTWSKRARQAMLHANVHTLEHLTRVDPTKMLKCPNVGKGTLKKIQQNLSARGMSLNFTPRQLRSMRVWPPEKRVAQSEAIRAAHAKTRAMNEREQEERLQDLAAMRVEGIEKNFVESMEMASGAGAIAEARSLLDCCTPLMAKTIIAVVAAIESEDK